MSTGGREPECDRNGDERAPGKSGGRGPSGQDADVGKTERILNLVSCLLKERRPVPWREIAGRVVGYDDGSDPRSLERRFERDKASLKEMGVRIVYCPPGQYETEGYMIPREACFLDKLELLPHESALLDLLSELALRMGGAGFSADLMSALQKLRFDASVRARPLGARTAPGSGGAVASPRQEGGLPSSRAIARPIVFPLPESEVEDAGKTLLAPSRDGAVGPDGGAPAPPEKRKRGRPRKTPAPPIGTDKGFGGGDPRMGGACSSGVRVSKDGADDELPERALGLAPRAEGAASTPLESSLLDLDLAGALRADPNVELLTHSLLANRAVGFTYYSVHSNETRRREMDPYGIGFSRGAWYVVGWDHMRREVRQFRLDRIVGPVEPIGVERAFKAPKDFRVTEYLEKPVWEMATEAPLEVEIEVAPAIAFFVEDLIAGKGDARPGAEPGSARVKLDVRDRRAFVKWALAHLRHVRVIHPPEVRAELVAAIETLREKHA
jgi:predicted DNA-binding transcriptional regulator YafY